MAIVRKYRKKNLKKFGKEHNNDNVPDNHIKLSGLKLGNSM